MLRSRLTPLILIASAALLASACSVSADVAERPGPEPIAVKDLVLGEPTFVEFLDRPFEAAFSPLGSGRWAGVEDDMLCVSVLVAPGPTGASVASDRSCIEVGSRIDPGSLSWALNGSSILVNEDVVRFLAEPDIRRVDVVDGTIEIVADDGVDDIDDPRASLDFSGFEGSAGATYFFELEDFGANVRLWQIDADGNERETGIDLAAVVPRGPMYAVGPDQFVFAGYSEDVRSDLYLLDVASGEFGQLRHRGLEEPWVVAAGDGVAVVIDRRELVRSFRLPRLVVIDIALDRPVVLDLDVDGQATVLVGVVPDGSGVLVLRRVDDDNDELAAYPRDTDGELGDPVVLAAGSEWLGTNASGDRREPAWSAPLTWTEDNRLLIPLADDELAVFDLASSS